MKNSSVIIKKSFEQVMDSIRLGVFDLLHTGIAIIDSTGCLSYCNKSFLDMYCLPSDIEGRHVSEFFMVEKGALSKEMATGQMVVSLGMSTKHIYGVFFRYPIYDQEMNFCGVAIESIPSNLSQEKLNMLLESMRTLEMKIYSSRDRKYGEKASVNTFSGMIGQSQAMASLRYLGLRFAPSNEPVLVTGESGTGKELVAHALHNASQRSSEPFVSVNCAALPAELIEAELFGYDQGAFTGARSGGMKGKFEQANGGTIFLDEIGELPLSVQAKLLRVLENGEVQKLGHRGVLRSNFRLVGATNRDLAQMIRQHQFREDLYHRLSVFELNVPPLREREDDIFVLTRHYLEQYTGGDSNIWLDQEMENIFRHYSWPGNIRELKNTLVYALYALGSEQKVMCRRHLPQRFIKAINNDEKNRAEAESAENSGQEKSEHSLLKATLERLRYNKAQVARELGMSRSKLYRLLHKHGLQT